MLLVSADLRNHISTWHVLEHALLVSLLTRAKILLVQELVDFGLDADDRLHLVLELRDGHLELTLLHHALEFRLSLVLQQLHVVDHERVMGLVDLALSELLDDVDLALPAGALIKHALSVCLDSVEQHVVLVSRGTSCSIAVLGGVLAAPESLGLLISDDVDVISQTVDLGQARVHGSLLHGLRKDVAHDGDGHVQEHNHREERAQNEEVVQVLVVL